MIECLYVSKVKQMNKPAIVYVDTGVWIDSAADEEDAIKQAIEILKERLNPSRPNIGFVVEWEDPD